MISWCHITLIVPSQIIVKAHHAFCPLTYSQFNACPLHVQSPKVPRIDCQGYTHAMRMQYYAISSSGARLPDIWNDWCPRWSILQRTTRSPSREARLNLLPRCSPSPHSAPSRPAPRGPSARATPWRSGSPARCAASATAAMSRRSPASRRSGTDARASTWARRRCRMGRWAGEKPMGGWGGPWWRRSLDSLESSGLWRAPTSGLAWKRVRSTLGSAVLPELVLNCLRGCVTRVTLIQRSVNIYAFPLRAPDLCSCCTQ